MGSTEAASGTRSCGLQLLDAFASSAGSRYAKFRNFDFGPERRGNVSRLSPFVSHRLVLETELLETVLRQHSAAAASKFVQEVFWRTYFKGWMEQRPSAWAAYRATLSQLLRTLESDPKLLDRYNAAIAGNTGIDCFDAWVEELQQTGYLHNHARMWFASIWVYTLRLPWQLGADFFYRHLLDGDPASNTLSWRWICGLHTRGKTYLARVSNIVSYTNNRFNPQGQLATSARPLTETEVFPTLPLPEEQHLSRDERFGLLITEADCFAESLRLNGIPRAVIGATATRLRSPLPIGVAAHNFATGAVTDAVNRASASFDAPGEFAEADDWYNLIVDWATRNHLKTIATAYAPVGPVAEQLGVFEGRASKLGIRLVKLRRPYDSVTWPHATHGYFRLKDKIPVIIDALGLANSEGAPHSKAG